MKFKLLFGVLGIITFLVVGMPKMSSYLDSNTALESLDAQNEIYESTLVELQSQLDTLKTDADLNGKTEWVDAAVILTKMSTLPGGELLETSPTASDLTLLDTNIDALECKYSITDVDTFISGLRGANVPVGSISIDYEDNLAIVSVQIATSSTSTYSNPGVNFVETDEVLENTEDALPADQTTSSSMLYEEEMGTEVGGINETTDY